MTILAYMIRIILAFAVACLIAGLIKTLFVITPSDLIAEPARSRGELAGLAGLLALATATHSAFFALPFAAIAIILARWLQLGGPFFYMSIGLVIAVLGFAVQLSAEAGNQPTIVNTYAFAAFATAGMIAGLVFSGLAGSAVRRRSRPDFVIARDSELANRR